MTKLSWDQSGANNYESGIDCGVIYTSDGRVSAWSGLVSVTENFNNTSTPVYFDGQKISDFSTPGAFSGTINAVTYPDILNELLGVDSLKPGVYLTSQRPKTFGFSYRTKVGGDYGYKIHIVYNTMLLTSEISRESLNSDASFINFSWDMHTVPEEIEGFLPTSHFIIDSRTTAASLLAKIETILYGGETANPYLPSFSELVSLISKWSTVEIIDNNDGTWTATTLYDGYITLLDDGKFRLDGVDAVTIASETYQIQTN